MGLFTLEYIHMVWMGEWAGERVMMEWRKEGRREGVEERLYEGLLQLQVTEGSCIGGLMEIFCWC